MLNTPNIKALTFDTGGTILDWHSGFAKGLKKLKIKYNLGFSVTELCQFNEKKSLEKVTNQNPKVFNKF